jgi:hypothetical protein
VVQVYNVRPMSRQEQTENGPTAGSQALRYLPCASRVSAWAARR